MTEIKMIYNLNDWPEGHVGHLVPSEEVVNAFIEINNTVPIKNVLEIGFNTGWSTYIILKTLGKTTVTSIEIHKFNNAEIAVQRLKGMFPHRTNIIWGDSRDIYEKAIRNKSNLTNNKFDTAFIDGGHFPEIVEKDIELCKFLGIKNYIFDDGDCPNILPAIKKNKCLRLIKKYPYINIRKLNNKYFLKESKGWERGLHHYVLD